MPYKGEVIIAAPPCLDHFYNPEDDEGKAIDKE
jgi:hypothetical protein